MNFELKHIPPRSEKPREKGITMVMDKGLSFREAEDFIETCSPYTDIIKLGFGTSYVTPNLDKKLNLYREAKVPFYFGGTLFEAFIMRNQFDDYLRLIEKYKLEYVEVSDGSINLPLSEKCNYISKLTLYCKVLSEVGSKDANIIYAPYQWVQFMRAEFEAGAWKVIAEAREAGNVGVFRSTGEPRMGLVAEIIHELGSEKIIWEAPQKSQQVWFLKTQGCNVNLGNIAPNEVIPLETLRLGLRSDTFTHFLPKNILQEFNEKYAAQLEAENRFNKDERHNWKEE